VEGHGTTVLSPPRQLSAREREVLGLLVRAVQADADALNCQAAHATVVEQCSVQCGSVILAVEEGSCPPVDVLRGAPSTGEGKDIDGASLSVLLHFRDGYIRMLEVVRHDGETAHGIPSALTLSVYGTASDSPWRR